MMKFVSALLALGLLAGACSGGGDGDAAPEVTVAVTESPSSTTTTSTTTTSTTTTSTTTTSTTTATTVPEASDEEQIEAVLNEYWRIYWTVASNPPDPREELWAGVAVPNIRDDLAEFVQENLDAGRGIRAFDPEPPFVVELDVDVVDGVFAIAHFCLRDDGFFYELATEEVLVEARFVTYVRAELVKSDTGWLVDNSESVESFEGLEVAPCVAAKP